MPRPWLRAALASVIVIGGMFAGAAQAECTDPDLFATLPPAEREFFVQLAAGDPYGQGIFWKASRGDDTVFLLGTIHVPDRRHALILDAVAPFMAAADRVFFEVTAEQETDLQRQLVARPDLLYIAEPPSMIGRLSEDQWQRVAEALRQRGVPPMMGARMQPWYLALTLALPACAMRDIQAGEKALDHLLRDHAEALGKPLTGLDDIDAMIAMFSEDPLDKQLDDFIIALDTGQFDTSSLTALMVRYYRQEIRLSWEVAKAIALSDAGARRDEVRRLFDEMQEDMIDRRNADWTEILLQAAQGRTLFVAVGTAHLPMEQGLLARLGRAGFRLERMPVPELER